MNKLNTMMQILQPYWSNVRGATTRSHVRSNAWNLLWRSGQPPEIYSFPCPQPASANPQCSFIVLNLINLLLVTCCPSLPIQSEEISHRRRTKEPIFRDHELGFGSPMAKTGSYSKIITITFASLIIFAAQAKKQIDPYKVWFFSI